MKWGALVLGLYFSISGTAGDDDTLRIMGTVWLAASVILATIQQKSGNGGK